jgi:type VI secretion system protein ImpI
MPRSPDPPPARKLDQALSPPAAAASAEPASLAELLKAAGVPGGQLSPQTAAELGEVLRIVVQGVMEVLQARAEIKSQFRMPATRVQASDNNPLKFSPNVETALHTLLVERNRAFLPTARAFQDAFTDIRYHQIAILHGIRTAYASMLESFDPERLQEQLEGEGRRSLLGGGKGRFRDLYVEHFRKLSADAEESFRRLFGEVFAEAYEEQLERLKNSGGPKRA